MRGLGPEKRRGALYHSRAGRRGLRIMNTNGAFSILSQLIIIWGWVKSMSREFYPIFSIQHSKEFEKVLKDYKIIQRIRKKISEKVVFHQHFLVAEQLYKHRCLCVCVSVCVSVPNFFNDLIGWHITTKNEKQKIKNKEWKTKRKK